MNVVWSDAALSELDDIYQFIADRSALYASQTVDRITRCTRQLARFPLSGRQVPEFGIPLIRELIEPPYRIIYRVANDYVEIVAVLHGARSL